MSKPKSHRFDTLSLHAGSAPDSATGARATPIYQTASFVFPDSDHAAALFNMERAGHVYSRISNPTVAVLEERAAALEGGVGALGTASGQAALHLAIATLQGAGSHIVASRSLYGGSHNLLDYTLPRFGIETTFVDPRDIDAWRAAVRPNTRLFFGETLGNPGLDVLDIPRVSQVAHEHGVPLLVDSTFTTPWLMRPFDHGADLVLHSATKFLSGHGVVIGGVLVDSGRFDWDARRGARQISDADRALPRLSRHGVQRGVDDRGLPAAGAARRHPRLRRLHVAVHRVPDPAGHRDAAGAHAKARGKHAQGRRVPGRASAGVETWAIRNCPGHPDHALAKTLLPRGCGAVFSFNLRGTRAQGRKFIETLNLFSHLANVGDAKSLVIHPASTTHFRMSAEDLAKSGITEGTIRLSIGLEDAGRPDRGPGPGAARGGEELGVGTGHDFRHAHLGQWQRVLRVYRLPSASTRHNPTLMFVHGAANDHSVWALQSRYFAHHGFNVLAVDLPAHGRSAGHGACDGRGDCRLDRAIARRRGCGAVARSSDIRWVRWPCWRVRRGIRSGSPRSRCSVPRRRCS